MTVTWCGNCEYGRENYGNDSLWFEYYFAVIVGGIMVLRLHDSDCPKTKVECFRNWNRVRQNVASLKQLKKKIAIRLNKTVPEIATASKKTYVHSLIARGIMLYM